MEQSAEHNRTQTHLDLGRKCMIDLLLNAKEVSCYTAATSAREEQPNP
jgi:hypothetical protein